MKHVDRTWAESQLAQELIAVNSQTDSRSSLNQGQEVEPCVPYIPTDERNPPAQDLKSLVEWFSSDEFQARLTKSFGEAKKKAIEERDRILTEYRSREAGENSL